MRILALAATLLATTAFAPEFGPPECDAQFRLNVADRTLAVNETTTVAVYLRHQCELIAWQAFVDADWGVIEFVSVTFPSESGFDFFQIGAWDSTNQHVDLAAGTFPDQTTYTGNVAILTIRAIAEGTTTLTYTSHGESPTAVTVDGSEYEPCELFASQTITVGG